MARGIVLSWPWSATARCRVALYRRGWLQVRRLPRPAVSVGALPMGGTGKTPCAHAVATALQRAGRSVAVLSRGYGRDGDAPLLVSDGDGPRVDVRAAGDEPWWLARTLPGAPVAVAGRRERAADEALTAGPPVDVFVLDDAFQHVRVARDLDLLVVDSDAPFWESTPPPTGRLRESPAAAGRADAFLLLGDHRSTARRWLEHRHPGRPIVELRPEEPGVWTLSDYRADAGPGDARPAAELPTPTLAMAGIARPERFRSGLRRAGVDVAALRRFPDHHWFRPSDLEELRARMRELAARSVVTTEKDAGRLGVVGGPDLPVWVWRHRLREQRPGALDELLGRLPDRGET